MNGPAPCSPLPQADSRDGSGHAASRRTERLCLLLAFIGALMCVGSIYGNLWLRENARVDMPVFHKSKPAVADWPRRLTFPRG